MATVKTAELLTLLNMCEPNSTVLEHEMLVEQIQVMPDYQELASVKSYGEVYNSYFLIDTIKSFENKKIKQIKEVIPTLINTLQNIVFSLKNGNAPLLTRKDRPDFYDKAKLNALNEKLDKGGSVNYTNIPPEKFMAIFEDSTIKDGKRIFDEMDEKVTDFEAAISKSIPDGLYCISKSQIDSLENEFQDVVKVINSERKEKIKKWILHFINRLTLSVLAILVLAFVNSFTGLINDEMYSTSMAIILIASLVFVIGG